MIVDGTLDDAITTAVDHALEHHTAVVICRDGQVLLTVIPEAYAVHPVQKGQQHGGSAKRRPQETRQEEDTEETEEGFARSLVGLIPYCSHAAQPVLP